MSQEPSREPLDIYDRAARAASRQLAFTIVGSIVGIGLVLGGVVHGGGIGGIALGLFILIPFTALRMMDPTRWGSLSELGDTAEERKRFLFALRDRLADPGTPVITTKYGHLHLLSDVLVFADTADVEVVRTRDIVRFSEGETREKERTIRIETTSGRTIDVPMERKDLAAALRRLEPYAQGSSSPLAA